MSKSGKIVHICNLDKFIPPFIDFIEEHFDDFDTRHVFWVRGDSEKFPYRPRKNIINAPLGRLRSVFSYIKAVNSADKIILHGLFHGNQIRLLSVMPWLHKKCYWCIWGGDLYTRQVAKRTIKSRINEVFRRWLIRRIGHLITHIKGDVELARKWYGAKGKWHDSFMYTSNLFKDIPWFPSTNSTINILIGNSADPSNNHFEILEKLKPFKDADIQIYAPLSYGDQQHAKFVSEYGKELFHHKFTAVTNFMASSEYFSFLSGINIAIFNHKRQQAMGNTTTLLGMGKQVFLRSDTTQWDFLRSLGLTVFDISKINQLDLAGVSAAVKIEENINVVRSYFSVGNLVKSLRGIFE
jgi:dTDP-N-acetylfucosamine:lipid II N-acetylfucosaminyltransferase